MSQDSGDQCGANFPLEIRKRRHGMKIMCEKNELAHIMVDEATDRITNKPVKATTLERIRLFTEADGTVEGMSQPLQYGYGLTYVLERIAQPVEQYDLLMGRILEVTPDAEGEAFFQEICRRYARKPLPWDKGTQPFWVFDQGHTSFYWKDVISHGLSGLQARAEKELENRAGEGADQETIDFLTGAILVYKAIRTYLRRYAEKAGRAGLTEAAEACRNGADRPPETFREALQMLWAIMLIYCSMLAGNPTLTYGRLDQFLYPLYRRDIDEGRLTREEAGLLILDFYCKNNLIMGRGEHQLSLEDEELSTGWQRNLNFDAPQYLVLGGSDSAGLAATNDLTLLFAEQIRPRFKNPVIVFQYTKGLSGRFPAVWKALVKAMRDSASLMVYNDSDVISAYIRAGADPEFAANYEHYGCNWPCLPGMEAGGSNHRFMWEKRILPEEKARLDDVNFWAPSPGGLVGELMSVVNAVPQSEEPPDIEYFYNGFRARFRTFMRRKYEHALLEREVLYREAPGVLQFQDCFCRDTITEAKSFLCGGSKYYSVIQSYGGFATLVDCLTTLDALLFREKKLTLRELKEAMTHNFSGYEVVHGLCRSVPKLGSDSELSNWHGHRLLNMLTDVVRDIQKEYTERGNPLILVKECIETDTGHIRMGKAVGATPDGRLAGMPVSQNCQPSVGASINGLTARLRAMAQLPFDRIASGAQNLSIQPRIFAGGKGLELLAALVATYFEMGGLQLQISAADISELLDAQANPDSHRDLMVRVTGYSAVFVDMTREAQNDIISREMSAV
jgi:formate C-acetyltransferase